MPKSSTPTIVEQSISGKRRKSTGKRLRFEVFKRDGFTCQYCGAQPPDAVLVIDHIQPVSKGGDNDPLNLITSCETCNQGKADKTLGDRIVRPDADLLYLETQQEIAEIARYRQVMAIREKAMDDLVSDLKDIWVNWSGLDWSPASHVLRTMLLRYDRDIVDAAVIDVAQKVGSGYVSENGSGWVKYLHAVARNMSGSGEDGE